MYPESIWKHNEYTEYERGLQKRKFGHERGISFSCFLFRWLLFVPDVCLYLMFWVGRWSNFSRVNCFVLASRQMRYLNISGEAQNIKIY